MVGVIWLPKVEVYKLRKQHPIFRIQLYPRHVDPSTAHYTPYTVDTRQDVGTSNTSTNGYTQIHSPQYHRINTASWTI